MVTYAALGPVVEHVTPAPSAAYGAPVTTMAVVTQPVSTALFASETVLPTTFGELFGAVLFPLSEAFD